MTISSTTILFYNLNGICHTICIFIVFSKLFNVVYIINFYLYVYVYYIINFSNHGGAILYYLYIISYKSRSIISCLDILDHLSHFPLFNNTFIYNLFGVNYKLLNCVQLYYLCIDKLNFSIRIFNCLSLRDWKKIGCRRQWRQTQHARVYMPVVYC